jgi:uncharacterized protein
MAYTAFYGVRRLASAATVAGLTSVVQSHPQGEVLVFDDLTGQQIDPDIRGEAAAKTADSELRGRGRPRLGVIAKEVTLLPRHWDWLNVQPGGASVALRKLVEEARRTSGDRDRVRAAQEAAYRFLSAVAGNLPGFEEATRALFAYDRRRFTELIAGWSEDVRDYAIGLAFADRA